MCSTPSTKNPNTHTQPTRAKRSARKLKEEQDLETGPVQCVSCVCRETSPYRRHLDSQRSKTSHGPHQQSVTAPAVAGRSFPLLHSGCIVFFFLFFPLSSTCMSHSSSLRHVQRLDQAFRACAIRSKEERKKRQAAGHDAEAGRLIFCFPPCAVSSCFLSACSHF